LKLKLLAVIVAALFSVAGCGGDDNKDSGANTATSETTGTGARGGAATETLDVSLTDFKIDPANPRISKPGEIELRVKNDGGTVHSLEVEGPGGESTLASNLNPGQTGTLRVDLSKPGKYEWYCPIGEHRDFGMEGEVTVGGGGQTTTGETTTGETTTPDSGGSGSNGGSGDGY
jgi:plastocyanin